MTDQHPPNPTDVVLSLAPTEAAIRGAWTELCDLRTHAQGIGTRAHSLALSIGEQLDRAMATAGPKHFRQWADAHLPFDLATAGRLRKVRELPADSRQSWLSLDLVPARAIDVESDEPKPIKPPAHLGAIDHVLRWMGTVQNPGPTERGDTKQLFETLKRWHLWS